MVEEKNESGGVRLGFFHKEGVREALKRGPHNRDFRRILDIISVDEVLVEIHHTGGNFFEVCIIGHENKGIFLLMKDMVTLSDQGRQTSA